MIRARQEGRLSDGQLMRYIRRRDRDGLLEADASDVHAGWIDLLPRLYPEAKYLLTIRSCYDWLSAALDQLLEVAHEREARLRLTSLLVPGTDVTLFEVFSSPESLVRHFPRVAGVYLSDWAGRNQRLLDHIPENRLLIATVADVLDMERRIPDVARFLGVPSRSLTREYGRAALPPVRHGILGRVDPRLLEDLCARHCRALMSRFFPGDSLRGFLSRS